MLENDKLTLAQVLNAAVEPTEIRTVCVLLLRRERLLSFPLEICDMDHFLHMKFQAKQ